MASTLASIWRMASTIASSAVVISGFSASSPSRSLLSRFSPTCATDSSFVKPRNPQVPLIVWIVRKMLASVARLPGSFSRLISSRSRRSRFSLLSTRNSRTMSSLMRNHALAKSLLRCDRNKSRLMRCCGCWLEKQMCSSGARAMFDGSGTHSARSPHENIGKRFF